MIHLISFDPHKVNANDLHEVIANDIPITTWWHYLGSTYLIKTNSSVKDIADIIERRWPKQRYLIIRVDAREFNGWLPPKAWDWIRRNR